MTNRPTGFYLRYLTWLAAQHTAIDHPPSNEDEDKYWRERHDAETAKQAVLDGKR